MTRERKLLLITGALLISLLVAVASFSLGVYAGVHGWTAGPPAIAGPGGNAPRPANPQPTPPAEAARREAPQLDPRPRLIGQVRSVSGPNITLDTPQGPRLFQLAEGVQVVRASEGHEQPAALDEVVPGAHLAALGRIEGDGPKQFIAERLVLLPPPPDRKP